MFDKKEYWENRNKGIRGQGVRSIDSTIYTPEEWKKIKQKERMDNTNVRTNR